MTDRAWTMGEVYDLLALAWAVQEREVRRYSQLPIMFQLSNTCGDCGREGTLHEYYCLTAPARRILAPILFPEREGV